MTMSDKPTPPEDYECCESECSPCVWDIYYDEMREWQAEQTAIKNAAQQASQSESGAE
mgnify:CR=1 FL=1